MTSSSASTRSWPDKLLRAAHVMAGLLGLTLITSCGPIVGLPDSGEAQTYYTLPAASNFDDAIPHQPLTILVEGIITPGDLDSNRIALHPSPLEVQYFAKVRWSDRVPGMLQTLLVSSFENSTKIRSAGTESMGIPADYRLKTSLRGFQADYKELGTAPTVNVSLSVKLVRKSPLELIDNIVITKSAVAESDNMAAIVAAFDRATSALLQETVNWTLSTAATDRASSQ